MSIIVDTNCFACLLCRSNKEHKKFAPVLEWIVSGRGFLVFGGTKYKDELKKSYKFLHFVRNLKLVRKVVTFDDRLIDDLQAKYEQKIVHPNFDDPHLPAIVLVSKCRLICSKDKHSAPFVTSPSLYPPRFHIPKYYSGLKDIGLLVDSNIDSRLQSHKCQMNKKQRKKIYQFLETL